MSFAVELNREAIDEALGTLFDPCSVAVGCPMSIVEMDLVSDVRVNRSEVTVVLELTEPTCMFALRIMEEVRRVIAEVGPRVECRVELTTPNPEDIWTEARIEPSARLRLDTMRRVKRHGT